MTKVMKKLSALLLAFALVLTMMPVMAFEVNAEEGNAFNVYINGVDTGKGVTREWLEENSQDAQVFPFPGGQGKKWAYVAAEGASFEAVLKETLGIESYTDLAGGNINWLNASGGVEGKFDLPVDMLAGAVTEFKLIDQDGNDVKGGFAKPEEGDDPITDVKAVQLEGAKDVEPVVSTKQKEFKTYEDAKAAVDEKTWSEGAETSIVPYVGGNLTVESQNYLKKDGAIKMGVFNFLGKFAIKDMPVMSITLPVPEPVDMVFDNAKDAPKELSLGYKVADDVNAALAGAAEWSSSDEAVAAVEEGKAVPKGVGNCVITAKVPGSDDVIGSINVTVNDSAFSVSVNGVKIGTISRAWLEENSMGAQVFPFAGGQGKKWVYVIAEGASFEAVLKEALGIESYKDLAGGNINWLNASGGVEGKFDLPVDMLAGAVTEFKLVDQDGNDVKGGFAKPEEGDDPITDVKAVQLEGASDVVPVISTIQKEYKTYGDAEKALTEKIWSEGAETSIVPYVGGNLTDESQNYLKKDGNIKMGVFNFVGKFAIKDMPVMSVIINVNAGELVFDSPSAAPKKAELVYPEKIAKALSDKVTWETSDEKVAAVASGQITPVGEGKCTVKAVNGEYTVQEYEVTVKAPEPVKPAVPEVKAPAVPKNLKIKNIKKKSAKLTWKKVTGATGYQVYRSTKKTKGFKKVATIKKSGTVKYVNKKLKKGKTYYYKIRAYKTVNGKTKYSKFTSPKKVKIKK